MRWPRLLCLVAAACNGSASTAEPATPPSAARDAAPINRTEPSPMSDPRPTLSWRAHEFAEARLRLRVIDGPEVERIDRTADGSATSPDEAHGPLGEQAIVQTAPPIFLRVSVGPDATIEGWRKRIGAFITAAEEPGEKTTVCGKPADRLVARLTSRERLTSTARGKIKHEAQDRTSVLVAFQHAGKPVLVGWTVETAERERHRADEAAFFAGIECL